jgi:hypothetical protein
MKTTCSIVVVYEDTTSREKAVCFCDGLAQRFWAKAGFDVSWWSFDHLQSNESAREAAAKAVDADFVVFAVQPESDVPAHVQGWAETWLQERNDREGTLVGLANGGHQSQEPAAGHAYLRELAHRAGMDYLTQMPPSIAQPMPDSCDSYTERADRVTGVLDEILKRPCLPRA